VSCPGLHCPGCSPGQSLGVIGAAAVGLVVVGRMLPWVADRILWIGGTLAVCFALSVAAAMALQGWADRLAARFAAAHGILSRADVLRAEAATFKAEVLPPQQPQTVITGGTHLWVAGQPTPEQSAVIRRALGRNDL
jgi:hypothetical protein